MSAETLLMLISVRRLGELLQRLPERTLRTECGPLLRVFVNGRRINGVRSWVAEDADYHARNMYGRLPSPSKPGHSIELHADGFALIWPDAAPMRLWWPEGTTTADLLPSAEEDEEAKRRRLVMRYAPDPMPPSPKRYQAKPWESLKPTTRRVWQIKRDERACRVREMRADPVLRPLLRRYGFRAVCAHLAILEEARIREAQRMEAQHARETLAWATRLARRSEPQGFRMQVGEGVAIHLRKFQGPDDAAAERRARAIREAEKLQLSFTLVSEATS